ncbi:hypothetical protein, conserved [Eimeria praecox]|uniref:Uncharacterized protein n=1 Tax=Eimeria praecox TaxID=51316 RepID=U6GFJ0_9EIME|nr:hypothetical protein, conserved [Eimeria praecox]
MLKGKISVAVRYAQAQKSTDPFSEERSVKLSESTAFDKLAYYSSSRTGKLESVLQSAVSAKSTAQLKRCSSSNSMVWRHSKQGGAMPVHSSQAITAGESRCMLASVSSQRAALENMKPGSQATTRSDHRSREKQKRCTPQQDGEAAFHLSRHVRAHEQQVAGRCHHLANRGSANRALSSLPSKCSQNHRSTELHNVDESKGFSNGRLTRSRGPDVPGCLFRSGQPRESSSAVDEGDNILKRSLESSSAFGSKAGITSRRRSGTTDVHSDALKKSSSLQPALHERGHMGKPRIDGAAPTAFITRPSYMDATAVGRRLTAQNNMWSAVGSYEPLASLVFHELYPPLSRELQALCMQCLGTKDSPELRALTDIQQAAMKLVAEQSVHRSAKAKNRLADVFERAGHPNGTLECLEQFLLACSPILIYFDIVSLTPHLEQGGFIRSHFEIPQTDATYLRKCNEREQALYCGLYEHESVRPEHHPKYGYVSVDCKLQPPWEPQSGEACIILKDHVRVRATISAGVLSSGHEPLVATLNNPWHVLEALGYEALAALADFAKDPTPMRGPDIPALVDCNIHGGIQLGKDVEAIVLPKSAEKATLAKLQQIATQHLVPILSMEKCPRAVKDDSWKQAVRHLQHEAFLKKTALGNTYAQI